MDKPVGLWPFTEMMIEITNENGFGVLIIEAHDATDPEEPDFIWGEYN